VFSENHPNQEHLMSIKIAKKQVMTIAGRAGVCCGSCCAPVGVN